MIRVESLRKTYGDFLAVHDVSFVADAGAIFGLLGPNGAGKTTTIGCISGLLRPSGGRVSIAGRDVVAEGPASRERLGVVPQEIALYEELSARDNLEYWAAAYGIRGAEARRRAREVLEMVGLADRAKEPVKKFSGGMKRRLNFACGIVHRPAALLLDEPTAGVDPQSRARLLELVREEARQGTCVVYTTHYMEEAQALCDRLAIVDAGRVVAAGTMEELRSMIGERDVLRLAGSFDEEAARRSLARLDGVDVVTAEAEALTLAAAHASSRLPAIFQALAVAGAEIRETTLTQPSLETLFLKLTGKELRE